jgi:hypothetical protein
MAYAAATDKPARQKKGDDAPPFPDRTAVRCFIHPDGLTSELQVIDGRRFFRFDD